MNVQEIQEALKKAHFDPGPVDGVMGRLTIAAIKAFQKANGLDMDGIVGKQTAARLFQGDVPQGARFDIPVSMPWLQTAFNLLGTREQPGRGSNEAIIGWSQALDILSYTDDDIPWCGLFVAHCIGAQLQDEPLPNGPLAARSWAKFGRSVTPQLGAVMVFWRGSRTGPLGHVGFYWAEDDGAYQILGGNQSNSVSIARLDKNRLLDARWPATSREALGVTRLAATTGTLSENEA